MAGYQHDQELFFQKEEEREDEAVSTLLRKAKIRPSEIARLNIEIRARFQQEGHDVATARVLANRYLTETAGRLIALHDERKELAKTIKRLKKSHQEGGR